MRHARRSTTVSVLGSFPLIAASIAGGCALPPDGAHASDPGTPAPSARPANAGYTPLFNGRDLTGWTASGDIAAFNVEDGEIVVTDAAYGGWLRTDKTYRDFDLVLEFNVPEGGNSGVGLRGSSGGDPAFTGFEVQIFDNFGDAPDLRSCGSVYEAIAADSMAVNRPGEWNAYRIRLVGDTLNVWLNGVQIHDNAKLDGRGFFRSEDSPLPLNTRATTGYIALQDHGDPVRFRNIAIRDLSIDPEPAGMEPLIASMDDDGPAGWFAQDDAVWTVEDGDTLVGRDGPGHLFTDDESFTDFEFRGLVKVNERGNSGIYLRVQPNPDMVWPVGYGYEAQIDNHDANNSTGAIYDMCPAAAIVSRDTAWFDYRIRAEGDRIRTWINSVPMADCERDDYTVGRFALQGHHPGNVIMFRDLRVKRLGGK